MLVHKLFNIAHTWNFNPATSLQLKLVGPPCLPSHLNQKISSSQQLLRGPQALSENSSSTPTKIKFTNIFVLKASQFDIFISSLLVGALQLCDL